MGPVALYPLRVVGGDDDGDADLMEGFENLQDFEGGLGIEISRGLVGQQDGRPIDHRPGNRQALLLAAGEGYGTGLFAFEQTDLVEGGLGATHRFAARQPDDLQGQKDVVENCAVEEEFLVLENQSEMAAQIRQGRLGAGRQILSVDHQAAGGGTFDGGNEV